jgi:hypothetical protein
MGFQRINVTLTDSQYRLLMLESNATGLKVGTIIRMLLHDDIASGRAVKHYRMKKATVRDEMAVRRAESEAQGE